MLFLLARELSSYKMKTSELLTHLLNFLLLPCFMGVVVALFAKLAWMRKKIYLKLMLTGILGSLMGLVIGWVVTGQDGRMLSYGLSAALCAFFVTLAGQGK